jgi:uncharacterized protein (DUF111 family)
MWESPEKLLQGHVDCSRGVCETSLLGACIDAASGNDAEEKWLIGAIQRFFVEDLGILHNEFEIYFHRGSPAESLQISLQAQNGVPKTEEGIRPSISLPEMEEALSRKHQRQIPEWVKHTSLDIISELVKVEAKVRGLDEGDIEINKASIFHVLGIICCLHSMGVRRVSCTPIPYRGTDLNQSISAAITKELLLGMVVQAESLESPCPPPSTPLGVALLRVLSGVHRSERCQQAPMILRRTGSGNNSANNMMYVSLMVGEMEGSSSLQSPSTSSSVTQNCESDLWLSDTITHLETNLDDTTGEILAFVIEMLLQHGAIDAWVTPIVMKKGRPAHTLHCLCKSGSEKDETKMKIIMELIFRHTTTLGVRIYRDLPRAKLCRSFVTAQTPYSETTRKGIVDVKVSKFKNGETIAMKVEFDHCKDISNETGVPLKVIAELALSAAREQVMPPPPKT